MRLVLAGLGAVALAGCAGGSGADPAPRIDGECQAEPGQRFVGEKASAETGGQLLAATGARVIRWIPPRTMVTMDFRADRLTVSYNDEMVIERVACT